MATTIDPLANDVLDEAVSARAAQAGFRLVQYETDTGQLIWEWRNGHDPRPQFVSRRVAVHWMAEFLTP